MRGVFVCRRPAVSASTTSMPISLAFWIASKITAPGSAPSLPFTTSQPTRLPHTSSCCTAAARNVSPAASTTDLALGLQLGRELADRRRLADAVDADHEARPSALRDVRFPRRRCRGCAWRRREARPTPLASSQSSFFSSPSRRRARMACGRRDADVGGEQDLFDLVGDGRVETLSCPRTSCASRPKKPPSPRAFASPLRKPGDVARMGGCGRRGPRLFSRSRRRRALVCARGRRFSGGRFGPFGPFGGGRRGASRFGARVGHLLGRLGGGLRTLGGLVRVGGFPRHEREQQDDDE